jgi:hypothetical protein
MNKVVKKHFKTIKCGSVVSDDKDKKKNMYVQLLEKLLDTQFTFYTTWSPRATQRCNRCFGGWNGKHKSKCIGCGDCNDVFIVLHPRPSQGLCVHATNYKPKYDDSDWRENDAFSKAVEECLASVTHTFARAEESKTHVPYIDTEFMCMPIH